MLLPILLKRIVREGSVRLIDAKGREHLAGDGSEPVCTLRVRRPWAEWKVPFNPPLYFGEAYMDGDITVEDGDVADFLALAQRNYSNLEREPLFRFAKAVQRVTGKVLPRNPIGRAQQNVAHHYDLSDDLYELFLDRDRQYSCAYFATPEHDLDQAQQDKMLHIAAKLLLEPGKSVYDIGSGWGGLGMFLAKTADVDVTGVTLSVEQHKVANERAQSEGVDGRVNFHLRDYRLEKGKYDRVVSVGMFEHVGKRHYDEFFAKLAEILDDDGVALLHSIGRLNEPGPVNPFIRKYIFPGTDVPCLSEVTPVIERAGLLITDVEILRLHYAETLKEWRKRFKANWDKAKALYDERFCRMWELYLAGCEMGFRYQGLMVFQIQLAKKVDAVPLTRDYIYEFERAHKQGKSAQRAA